MRIILLQRQARAERALAAKQSDPTLRRMIENSATGKEELAQEIRTGRPIAESRYEQAAIHSQQSARLTVKR